jgi:hypothetical protein
MTEPMERHAPARIFRISYKPSVKVILIVMAVGFTLPVCSKEIWLQCGDQQLFLNEQKETVSTEVDGLVVKSAASFFPKQINFEIKKAPPREGRLVVFARDLWLIDRSNLSCSKTSQVGHSIFRGSISWMPEGPGNGIRNGTCKLIPSPTKNNLI